MVNLLDISELLSIDENSISGAVWSKNFKRHRKGSQFGYLTGNKRYWRQKISNKQYAVHNLIWIKSNGLIPSGYTIDHIDNNGLNNSITNLRLATVLQQLHNRKTWSTAELRGVSKVNGYENYAAYIMYPGKGRIHLGYYKLKEHAAIAHDIAATILFVKSNLYKINFKDAFWLNRETKISEKVLYKIDAFFKRESSIEAS